MHRHIRAGLPALAAAAAIAAGTAATAQEFAVDQLPQTEIQFIGTSAGSPPWEIVDSFFSKTLPERTGGRVNGDVKSITELGIKGADAMRMIRRGLAHMMDTSMGMYSGEVPEVDGMDLSGLVPDIATLRQTVNVYEPELERLYDERLNARLLGLWPLAGQVFWCAVPIAGLDDLKGKKVRVFTASMADFVEAIGAIPTTITFSEVVPALQRKVVDCAVTGTVAGNLAKWTEVTTHVYPLVVGWGMHATLASKPWWDGLDPVLQTWLRAATEEMVAIGWQQAQIGTDQGLWCSTGDDRCQPDVIKPKPLTRTNLTLVPVTAEDKARARKLLEGKALDSFAERCGADCAALWNRTVGKALDVKAGG